MRKAVFGARAGQLPRTAIEVEFRPPHSADFLPALPGEQQHRRMGK